MFNLFARSCCCRCDAGWLTSPFLLADSFRILVTSENSGLIETINDAVSVHSLKKNAYASRAEDGTQVFDSFTLYDHFVNVRRPLPHLSYSFGLRVADAHGSRARQTYGPVDSKRYRQAQDAFIESLAAYSVICYLLQLKDRHNGNILLDLQGHLIRASPRAPALSCALTGPASLTNGSA